MTSRYKIRAYCSSPKCDYVQPEDVIEAINYETAYSLAQLYNELPSRQRCPECGERIAYYSHTIVKDPFVADGI